MAAPSPPRLDPDRVARVYDTAAQASAFFMNTSDVHSALGKITRLLEEAGVPYALVDALALGEYGYRRLTVDIDLLQPSTGSRSISCSRGTTRAMANRSP